MNEEVSRLAVPVGEDDHVRGPEDALITLVEYGDFECPYTRIAYRAVKAIEKTYAATLRFVFREYPLHKHPQAYAAAETAEFAADHGRFWEMYDRLFERPGLSTADLLRRAQRLGLDESALAQALRTRQYRPLVEEVKEGGDESGVSGTPAFFLNDVLFEEDEVTVETLSEAIESLLVGAR